MSALRLGLAAGALGLGAALLTAAPVSQSVAGGGTLEARKLPMRFTWNDCKPDCKSWVAALGIVTGDTPALFEDFAKEHDLTGATILLDSSGGSVNDAITLGRRFRALGIVTSVATTIPADQRTPAAVMDGAYCESMCAFLLLAGKERYVPEGARVRVHQIWMGDRAEDPKAASYSAQDLMIVERDVGRLAKFTFDMGGTGDLLELALGVPPWEDLHTMTMDELRAAHLVTTEIRPDAVPAPKAPAVAALTPKLLQDRFTSENETHAEADASPPKATQTAEATGGRVPAK